MEFEIISLAKKLDLDPDSDEFAARLDQCDPLRRIRAEFAIPLQVDQSPVVYLCGNSLGLMPHRSRANVNHILDVWSNRAVLGHFERNAWADLHERAVQLSTDLVGAKPSEIVLMNGLSVNLHLLLITFFRPTSTRYKIIVEDGLFCSDSHVLISQLRLHNLLPDHALIRVRPRSGQRCLQTDDILDCIRQHGASTALVLFGGLQYYTGQLFDMPAICRTGHEVGAVVGFDLAHATGNVALRLHDWDVDFAVWCNYKYLNSGPGAIAGAFVHERHHGREDIQRLEGWWGQTHDDRFQMEMYHRPAPGAASYHISNPNVLGLAAYEGAAQVFKEATLDAVAAKQRLLTGYLEWLLHKRWRADAFEQITPTDVSQRGSQLSILFHANAAELNQWLADHGVVCDYRRPDVIRLSPAPLYNTYEDVRRAVLLLEQALEAVRS